MRKNKKETLVLECILTDKEKLAYSKDLGDSLSQMKRGEEKLKSFQTQAKAELAGLDAKINSLADKVNTGREHRDVECEVVLDFKNKEKVWTRTDTGEIAKSDIITEKELQEELAL
jgi:hypothetical protein